MKQESRPVTVVFRKFHGGGVIALFPEIPADGCHGHCLSYETLGQHGAASSDLSHCTVTAAPEEYAELKRELESLGYVLAVRTRITSRMHGKRRAALTALEPVTPFPLK